MDKVKIEIGKVEDIKELMEKIFWKKPELGPQAETFIREIKNWSRSHRPYTTDQWKSYCKRKEISQSSYHNMLKRLRQAGLVEKKYNPERKKHELYPSSQFSQKLMGQARVWEQYKKN